MDEYRSPTNSANVHLFSAFCSCFTCLKWFSTMALEIGQCSGSYQGKYMIVWKKHPLKKIGCYVDSGPKALRDLTKYLKSSIQNILLHCIIKT